MYKHRNVISAVILTFVLTSLFYLTVGSNVLNFIGSLSGDSFSKLKRTEKLIDKYYIDKYDKKQMEDAALESYVASLGDKYADYISSDEFEDYKTMISGDYKGIGVEIYIDDDNLITVQTVYENSPASKGGIMVNDRLIKANETDISYENYTEALNIIKGVTDSENDTVKLTIKRGDEIIEKDIVREVIEINYVTEKTFDDIYYIRLSSFEGKSAQQFETAITNAENKKAKGVIIDLRNNPGGTLESVLEICDRVLDKGVILTIKSKSGNEDVYNATDDKKFDIPICILVNGNTASAAEVFTAALKDHGKATVVGTKTFGKGIVQNIFILGDNSALKFTASKYYTPNDVCIHKIGITPDKVVHLSDEYKNMTIETIPFEHDAQLNEALNILNK